MAFRRFSIKNFAETIKMFIFALQKILKMKSNVPIIKITGVVLVWAVSVRLIAESVGKAGAIGVAMLAIAGAFVWVVRRTQPTIPTTPIEIIEPTQNIRYTELEPEAGATFTYLVNNKSK